MMKQKLAWILAAALTVSTLPSVGVFAADPSGESVIESVDETSGAEDTEELTEKPNNSDSEEEPQALPAQGAAGEEEGIPEENTDTVEETVTETNYLGNTSQRNNGSGTWIYDEQTHKTYYKYSDGTFASGWTEIDEETYFFDTEDNSLKTGWYQDEDDKFWYYLDPENQGAMATGFVTVGSSTYYLDDDGHLQTGKWLTVEGKKYYADNYGNIQKGWKSVSGKWYYFDPADGYALATGLVKNGSTTYLTNPSTGALIVNGFADIDGKRYASDSAGVVRTGWNEINKKWYYSDPADNNAIAKGILNTGTKSYLLDPDTGALIVKGIAEVDGETYASDGAGVVLTGWNKINNKWYYSDPDNNNAFAKGVFTIGDRSYLLDPDTGEMLINGAVNINGKVYTSDKWGIIRTGSGWTNRDGKWYYYDPDEPTACLTGILELGNSKYLTDPETGALVTNGTADVDGKTYAADGYGNLLSGWNCINNKWYYSDPDNGDALAKGLFEQNGTTYVLDPKTGALITNEIVEIDGKSYGANQWGVLCSGWCTVKNKWYYFDPDNDNQPVKGIATINGSTYLLDPSTGELVTNYWRKIDNKWYHADKWGYLQTGWIGINDIWYYLDPEDSGAMVTDRFIGEHFVNGYGIMQVGTSFKYDGKLYVANEYGVVQRKNGWILVKGDWYYSDNNEGILKTGWVYYNSCQYYCDPETGKMYKGPHFIDKTLYFFDLNNGWLLLGQNRWVRIPNTPYWYYVYTDGKCAVSKWVDGYWIDEKGIWYEDPLYQVAVQYTSATKYLIVADRERHWLAVYEGTESFIRDGRTRWRGWKQIKGRWRITTGAMTSRTPKGEFVAVFHSDNPWGYYTFSETKAAYCLYFSGGFFIHSILFDYKNDYSTNPYYESVADGDLGVNRSHSCIRLSLSNAEWVYKHIPDDTKLIVFDSTSDY